MVELTVTRKSERDEAIELLKTDRLHLIYQGQNKKWLFERHPPSDEYK